MTKPIEEYSDKQVLMYKERGAAKALKRRTNDLIAPDARTIRRWENGETKPNQVVMDTYRNMLKEMGE